MVKSALLANKAKFLDLFVEILKKECNSPSSSYLETIFSPSRYRPFKSYYTAQSKRAELESLTKQLNEYNDYIMSFIEREKASMEQTQKTE